MIDEPELLARAAPGVHETVARLVISTIAPGSRIIDLGAGQGALGQRLAAEGFQVTAVDVNVGDFRATAPIEYCKLDFNNDSEVCAFVEQRGRQFDVALGVEVIEHLENPWSYVRALSRLAIPRGLVVVTTPNTASWHSRLTFLRRGEFDDFGERGQVGHVNPVSPWELQAIMTSAGIEDIRLEPISDIYAHPSRIQSLIRIGARALRPAQSGLLDGICVLASGRAPA